MRGRVRVLHVIQNLNYGGMERLLADIVLRADRGLIESHVLCLQYLGRFSEGLANVAELHLAKQTFRAGMLWPASLIRQIRSIGPQVVHTHSGVWYKASLAARRAGVPRLVHTEHGRRHPDPRIDRLVDGLAARRTDVVVAVSDALAAQLVATLFVSPRRIRVVRNGVDTGLHQPRAESGALRDELRVPSNAPILGSIGRLEPIKGYDVVVEGMALLAAEWTEGPLPVLVVFGEGSERARLLELARERRIAGLLYLPGWRDDAHDLHAASTIFTLGSRSEGTSVSLLEAMSAGLCPVVTDVGGNAAVLGPELRHRLVPAENAAALAAAWRDALGDAPRRAADGAVARQRVVREFDLGAMVRQYERIYLGEPSSGP